MYITIHAFFFLVEMGKSYLIIIKFIQSQLYPASRDIFCFSLGLPYPLQNSAIQNWNKCHRCLKVAAVGFPVSLKHMVYLDHPCLLHKTPAITD